eukprot:6491674-Amphidinium_carterae.3
MATPAKKANKRALDTAWDTLMSTQKSHRALRESEIAEQVRHSLAESCKWATCLERDGIIVDGKTLRERLWADKSAAARGEAVTFGHTYYKTLRRLYTSCDKIEQELDALTDETYEPPESLLLACAYCLKNIPNRRERGKKKRNYFHIREIKSFALVNVERSKLMDYVGTCTSMTRQDAIAVLKMFNDIGESSSTEQMHCCMGIVSHLARLKVWSTHDDLMQLMRQKVDGTLCEVQGHPKQ